MPENHNQPRIYDAVQGGKSPHPDEGVVLGGLEGVKRRLASEVVEPKIDALLDAFEYGQAGLDVVIQALEDTSKKVREAAYLLLQESTEPRVKQALRSYNPYARFKCLHTIQEQRKVLCLAVSSNARNLIGHCYNTNPKYVNTANVWDFYAGQLTHTFSLGGTHNNYCLVAVSPNGQTLVSNFQDRISVWNVQTGQLIHTFQTSNCDFPRSFAISPDEQTLIIGSLGTSNYPVAITVCDLHTGREIYNLQGHTSSVKSVIISPDGRILLSQSQAYENRLWSLQTGKLIRTIQRPQSWVADSLAISPDEQTIASGRREGSIKVWNLHTDQIIFSLPEHSFSVLSPDGKVLVCGSDDNTIKVWDVETGQELRTLRGHSNPVNSLAITPDGQTIVSGSHDGTIKVWGIS